MTPAQDVHQGFAWISQHGGAVVNWADAPFHHRVVGEGLSEWFASDHEDPGQPLSLSKHVDETNGTRMLELRLARPAAPGAKPVQWGSTLKVGKDRYVRASGSAADFPTALAHVESHTHESRQLGGLTWWLESQDRWISWLGAFHLSATKITGSRDEPTWHFEVRGDAPTLEEAALLAVMGRLDMSSCAVGQGT